jgi:phage terminase large subunit-like protein
LKKSWEVPIQKASLNYIKYFKLARKKQKTPKGNWNVWLILAGRGFGKTWTGAYDIVNYAMQNPNTISAVLAPTFGDLRRVCFEGVSGINQLIPKECFKKQSKAGYNRSTSEIHLWNGSKIMGFAASEPDRLRGSQYHRAWCDELAAWRYPEAYDQLMFGMRLGKKPQVVITTTPRPTQLIKSLFKRRTEDVYVTQGSTYENVDNLAPSALEQFRERYEGTRLGRQELYAEILDDVEGALWNHSMIDKNRVHKEELPEMSKIVIGIDPAVTSNANSDETGIIVASLGENGYYYILEDKSGKYSPDSWGRIAVELFYRYNANMIVAEINNGGDLVERLLRSVDRNVVIKTVHATRGKMIRAEPVSALYEQEKVFHCGSFNELEDQMCSYTGDTRSKSPDRLDALVWALTQLSVSSGKPLWRIS